MSFELLLSVMVNGFFFSSRRRHTRLSGDWSSDVCSSDLVGSPKRLRSDLNQTVSFPPTLFSSSTLRVYFKSILAHTCTASPLTSVMCSKNFCPFIYLFLVTLNSF